MANPDLPNMYMLPTLIPVPLSFEEARTIYSLRKEKIDKQITSILEDTTNNLKQFAASLSPDRSVAYLHKIKSNADMLEQLVLQRTAIPAPKIDDWEKCYE